MVGVFCAMPIMYCTSKLASAQDSTPLSHTGVMWSPTEEEGDSVCVRNREKGGREHVDITIIKI